MNREVKEIIEVAEELTHIGKRASKVGIIGVSPGEFQIYETDVFKKIVEASNGAPSVETKNHPEYTYWYRIALGSLKFLHISSKLIYPTNKMEDEDDR